MSVINPDDTITNVPIDGAPTGGVVFSHGTAYLTTSTSSRTVVSVINPDNTATTLPIDGNPRGGVVSATGTAHACERHCGGSRR